MDNTYKFLNSNGTFKLEKANKYSYLYFPLVGSMGMKSSITPNFHGDAKVDQNSFALLPVSQEDLHASLLSRNVWFDVDGTKWAFNGNSAFQLEHEDDCTVTGGFLYHTLKRTNTMFFVEATSFVPYENNSLECHRFVYKNKSSDTQKIKITTAIPIYGRSAETIRDHRHVTALLNHVDIVENGIINTPTMRFDEEGHHSNMISYGVFVGGKDVKVANYYPVLEEFIGEGQSLLNPRVIYTKVESHYKVGDTIDGYEVIGAMEFEEVSLRPNESFEFFVTIGIANNGFHTPITSLDSSGFHAMLEATKTKWNEKRSSLAFDIQDNHYSNWLKWVTIQPILRRLYGNSFLPHHDYGKGGRGWRDLWQDSLALLFLEPTQVKEMLVSNFAGVRIDGSNATIIGENDGEFIGDRNKIVRVWMDHGVWPFITMKHYIARTGDIDVLFEKRPYFYDSHTHYCKKVNTANINNEVLMTKTNDIYHGTILEHILIENLVPFFNVGSHNIMRLENADWNDGLDMAPTKGESVAFSTLYSKNLMDIATLLKELDTKGVHEIFVCEELEILLDQIHDPIDYDNISEKHKVRDRYFDTVATNVSGTVITISSLELAKDLIKKSNHIKHVIQQQEWLTSNNGAWFNGYYDDEGTRLESTSDPIRMTLTGQVFPIMSDVATNDQITNIIKAANNYLYQEHLGGYRLNTNFCEVKLNMGRMFGFAYGHKENGAVFSHMAVMYANALYQRGFVKAGRLVMQSLYNHAKQTNVSKMYPGLPEYFDQKGRGMYSYLTGSASWYLLTMVNEVYGIKGDFGNLLLDPKLTKDDFIDNRVTITTFFNTFKITIEYYNKHEKEYGDYGITSVLHNEKEVAFKKQQHGVVINKDYLVHDGIYRVILE